MAADLRNARCVPCEGGTPPLTPDEATALTAELDEDWVVAQQHRAIERSFTFKSFKRAMRFLNGVADIAEAEGHHPDFCLSGWNHVSMVLRTHAIDGLSFNDFILAAKIDQALFDGRLPPTSGPVE